MNRASTSLGALLLACLCGARAVGDVLLATDFNAASDWPALAAFSWASSGVTVSASRANVAAGEVLAELYATP